jgi:hypothetical protein
MNAAIEINRLIQLVNECFEIFAELHSHTLEMKAEYEKDPTPLNKVIMNMAADTEKSALASILGRTKFLCQQISNDNNTKED